MICRSSIVVVVVFGPEIGSGLYIADWEMRRYKRKNIPARARLSAHSLLP